MPSDGDYVVRTPESVAVAFELAGIGQRAVALIIDTILIIAVLLALSIGLFIIWSWDIVWMTEAMLIVLLLATGFHWAYFVVLEAFWGGQTLGKRYMRIRVVRDGGFPITFRQAAVRNVLRFVDALPSLYAIGILAAFVHPEQKRLGDMVAGTIVVREGIPRLEVRAGDRVRAAQEAATPAERVGARVALTPAQYELVTRFLERRVSLTPEVRAQLRTQILDGLLRPLRLSEEERAEVTGRDAGEGFLEMLARHGDTARRV